MFRNLDAIYERYRQQENIPGLVYGVVRDGTLAHVKALGVADLGSGRPVREDTFFRIASMTKCITSLAVLLLRDRGKLSLDAPVAELVPAFAKVALPTADSRAITLRDLLVHAGGFVTDDPWGDRLIGQPLPDFAAMLGQGLVFARAPQLGYEYSNLGYTLLGRVIETVSGEGYSTFVRREILQKLGMARTTLEYRDLPQDELARPYRHHDGTWSEERLEPDGAFGAMAGIVTQAPEYARFVAFLIDAWPARDEPESGPVARASRRELGVLHSAPRAPEFRPHQGRQVAVASAYGYGLVNSIDAELGRTLHHRGGLPGYGSHFLFSPETQIGLFSFANRTYAAMNEPNFAAAQALKDAGAWTAPPRPVSRFLAEAVDAVERGLRAGRIEEAASLFAGNFLLDAPAEERNRHLAKLSAAIGSLETITIEPIHPLHARIVLNGAKGSARGEIILTGESRPRIQTLDFDGDIDIGAA